MKTTTVKLMWCELFFGWARRTGWLNAITAEVAFSLSHPVSGSDICFARSLVYLVKNESLLTWSHPVVLGTEVEMSLLYRCRQISAVCATWCPRASTTPSTTAYSARTATTTTGRSAPSARAASTEKSSSKLTTKRKGSVDHYVLAVVVRTSNASFHPDCFLCVVCKKNMINVPFISDDKNQVYCIDDYNK